MEVRDGDTQPESRGVAKKNSSIRKGKDELHGESKVLERKMHVP